ncbi:MAG: TetR/AcrR family transcriptional regulator [Lachnospiraceae bacterium]|nr:TetR/AcrR family transcriptional regulator [Lachnospiraceae bacterium]
MITGSEEESRALMMNAAVQVVAQHGFEGFTTKKWAAQAGVAEGSLYYYFKSKHELLDETFFMIDHEIADLFSGKLGTAGEPKEFFPYIETHWSRYYNYFMDNPQKTLYYYRYKNSPRYTDVVSQSEEIYTGVFLQLIKEAEEVLRFADIVSIDMLRYFIMNVTTGVAYSVVTGIMKHTPETEQELRGLLMNGLRSLAVT